jgi:hypothetical protein
LIPISLRFILIFSSRQYLGLPKGLFPVDVPVEMYVDTSLAYFHSGYMTFPSQTSRLNHPEYIK